MFYSCTRTRNFTLSISRVSKEMKCALFYLNKDNKRVKKVFNRFFFAKADLTEKIRPIRIVRRAFVGVPTIVITTDSSPAVHIHMCHPEFLSTIRKRKRGYSWQEEHHHRLNIRGEYCAFA